MSWTQPPNNGPSRRGYHHGNLREALIQAAQDLIGAKGPAGFTIAEAARLAGVSPAAPYRHFRDAESLLAEVATRGFDQFRDRLAAALDAAPPTDPARAAEAVGRAYLAFAREEPAYYAAMFEARIAREPFPDLQAAGDRAFAVLRKLAERLAAAARIQPRPPALMIALHIWSTAHGIASLFGRADPSRRPLPMSTEDLLEAAVLIYLQGLGITVS
ncbi:MAG: TetR/AcrR family transcriptional regulator [Acetobacteraceae bacterium]|jgi:AcrR family transcriptional regulator